MKFRTSYHFGGHESCRYANFSSCHVISQTKHSWAVVCVSVLRKSDNADRQNPLPDAKKGEIFRDGPAQRPKLRSSSDCSNKRFACRTGGAERAAGHGRLTGFLLTPSSLHLHSLAMFADLMFLHCLLHHFSNIHPYRANAKGFLGSNYQVDPLLSSLCFRD